MKKFYQYIYKILVTNVQCKKFYISSFFSKKEKKNQFLLLHEL